jgi:hypothetical protein
MRVSVSGAIYHVLTTDITMECMLVAVWYNAQDAMHEIHGSNLNILRIQVLVFPSTYQYVTVRT